MKSIKTTLVATSVLLCVPAFAETSVTKAQIAVQNTQAKTEQVQAMTVAKTAEAKDAAVTKTTEVKDQSEKTQGFFSRTWEKTKNFFRGEEAKPAEQATKTGA